MRNRLLYTAGAIAVLVLAYAAGTQYRAGMSLPEATTIGQGVRTFAELSERFTALAEERGAVYAFDVLRAAKLPPETDFHLLGHAVGDVLYRQQGVGGIAYCTQDFRNACSHSIAIGTLNEYGEGALPLIRDACHKAPGGSGAYTMCYHGLGHGVFAYFRYDLPKTVAFCKKTGTAEYGQQEFSQCVGGAIMELISGGGHNRDDWVIANGKYLDPKDPLSPCMTSVIPEQAKVLCLSYLTPQLFVRAGANLVRPDPATFPKAMSFCEAIPTTQKTLRDACYIGFGKEFVPLVAGLDIRSVDRLSDAQYQGAAALCRLAPNTEAVRACIDSEVDSIFWGGENDPDGAFRFCALVLDSERGDCYKGLMDKIVQYTTGDTKAALCARLPDKTMQHTCPTTEPKIKL